MRVLPNSTTRFNTDSFVELVFLDSPDLYRFRIEHEPAHGKRILFAKPTKACIHVAKLRGTEPKEVYVPSGPEPRTFPDQEQRRSLEDEGLEDRMRCHPVKQSLRTVADQHEVVILLPAAGEFEQASRYGMSQVHELAAISRYGLTTLWIRSFRESRSSS
jgi:hypothetical protein